MWGRNDLPTRLWATWVSQTRPQSSLIEPLPTSVGAHGLMGMGVTKSTGDELDRDRFEGAKQCIKPRFTVTSAVFLLPVCCYFANLLKMKFVSSQAPVAYTSVTRRVDVIIILVTQRLQVLVEFN